MRPPEPTQPSQPPPDFLETDSFPPPLRALLRLDFFGHLLPWVLSRRWVLCWCRAPPSLPGARWTPTARRLSPNLNILRPLLGPDGVARPSHPVTSLLSGKGWGHQAGVIPPATALTAPPAFCPSIAGPRRCTRGDLGVDELRLRERTGLPLPPPSHSVPWPRVMVTTRTGTQLLRHQAV